MKYDVLNRFTGEVQFTAEIDCNENEELSIKLRLAVIWAIKNNANLSDANLYGANLRDTNLYGADLRYANLYGADLRGADLYILQTDIYTCWIQKEHIRIGCQYHSVDDWIGFDDEKISKMDKDALSWWKKWKPIIMQIQETLIKE